MSGRQQPVEDQLNNFKKTAKATTVSTGHGSPIGTKDAILTVGERGPALLQDTIFIDELSHFARERIPERVVHAKGAGAFGYFEVTHDITKYCGATIFEKIGKRTPMAVRFSNVAGNSGSADTVRDPRGFALKFYTEEGIWDIVGNNTPIFFIRDPMLFPSFIHVTKRNPETHLTDPNMFWDFVTLRPETTSQLLIYFSDRGIPDGHRFMHGFGSHTYKTINEEGVEVFVKFVYKSNQGLKNLDVEKASDLAGNDPDYGIRDLFNAIAKGDYPSWTFHIQVMTFEQAENWNYNPFDLTKMWPKEEFPMIEVGQIVLNRNPKNYFAEVEQLAFSPAHLVPGIGPSPDKMLQARLFAYGDTHRHRLGANYLQLPVNCPYKSSAKNYQRDGPMCSGDNQAGAPNYFPNSFEGPKECPRAAKLMPKFKVSGDVDRYRSGESEDNFSQAADLFYKILNDDERKRLVKNLVGHLSLTMPFIQERAVKSLSNVSVDFGKQIAAGLKLYRSSNL